MSVDTTARVLSNHFVCCCGVPVSCSTGGMDLGILLLGSKPPAGNQPHFDPSEFLRASPPGGRKAGRGSARRDKAVTGGW